MNPFETETDDNTGHHQSWHLIYWSWCFDSTQTPHLPFEWMLEMIHLPWIKFGSVVRPTALWKPGVPTARALRFLDKTEWRIRRTWSDSPNPEPTPNSPNWFMVREHAYCNPALLLQLYSPTLVLGSAMDIWLGVTNEICLQHLNLSSSQVSVFNSDLALLQQAMNAEGICSPSEWKHKHSGMNISECLHAKHV